MEFVVAVIVVVLIIAICPKPKANDAYEWNSEPAKNPYPYDMAWPKPSRNNLWDSFDYFVRVGEVWARHHMSFDEENVYLLLCLEDAGSNKKRGYFELRTAEFESIKRVYTDIPYLQGIELPFRGFDPDTSMLTMEQSEIRRLVMSEAKHATDIRFQVFGYYLSIAVKFQGIMK